jgi:lyso-ornithine lipid O-acyltransferase
LTGRRIWRAVALVFLIVLCVVRYGLRRLRRPQTLEERALWLHDTTRLVLDRAGVAIQVDGRPATHGLVVSNHLTYLDIPIYSAVMPCFFVSKAEVDGWWLFGQAARNGGTIFINRSSMASGNAAAEAIADRLHLPVPVLLFPEATSTDGAEVRKFHGRLMQPAIAAGAPITAAAIRYTVEAGVPEREVSWSGGEKFLPNVWKLLGMSGITAHICFGDPRIFADRRIAASETRAEVAAMREAGAMAIK